MPRFDGRRLGSVRRSRSGFGRHTAQERRWKLAWALGIALWLLHAGSAEGHAIGMSTGSYDAEAHTLLATLHFARGDLLRLAPDLDVDRDGHLSAGELARGEAVLTRTVVDALVVQAVIPGPAKARCPGRLRGTGLLEEDGGVLQLTYACPPESSAAVVDATFLAALGPGHRHVASGPSLGDVVLDPEHRTLSLPLSAPTPKPRRSLLASVWRSVELGLEHIAVGYDHLAFLFGLLLVRASLREMAFVVTAFTVGHSLSLALAVLGWVTPNASFVEPAIALSVVYVGVQALFVRFRGGGLGHGRWKVTLPFGFVHGLGFASALTELGLDRAELVPTLVGFNLGVEAAQVLVVCAVVPALALLRRLSWFERALVPVLAMLLVLAGAAWFVLRVAAS